MTLVSAPFATRSNSTPNFASLFKPPELELGLAVVRETERQADEVDRQWALRLEHAHYEARLAERRYEAIDPETAPLRER